MNSIKIITTIFRYLGYFCLLSAIVIFINLFALPVKQEFHYQLNRRLKPNDFIPPNTDFSISINKINATSPIVAEVDPYNTQIYQSALAKGVAHAAGTVLPGELGNIFLFAHSSADIFNAERFNSVFYLLHHVSTGDIIDLWYENQRYRYSVNAIKIVSPNQVQYIKGDSTLESLTLMTCYPPGTTFKRLLVIATRI